MRIYATLYRRGNITVQMSISPRYKNKFNQMTKQYERVEDGDQQIFREHVSKHGDTSIIYDPTIGITFSGIELGGESFMIHANDIYRVASILHGILQGLTNDSRLFRTDADHTFLDKTIAKEYTKRLMNWQKEVFFSPTIIVTPNGDQRGVRIFTKRATITTITQLEVVDLINMIEHLDITTCEIMASLLDAMSQINRKLTRIEDTLVEINRKLDMNKRSDRTERQSDMIWYSGQSDPISRL